MQDRGRQLPRKQIPRRHVVQQESNKLCVLTTDLPWGKMPSHSLRLNHQPLRTAGHLQYYPRSAIREIHMMGITQPIGVSRHWELKFMYFSICTNIEVHWDRAEINILVYQHYYRI